MIKECSDILQNTEADKSLWEQQRKSRGKKSTNIWNWKFPVLCWSVNRTFWAAQNSQKYDAHFDHLPKGAIIKSRASWYEKGGKKTPSTSFNFRKDSDYKGVCTTDIYVSSQFNL